MKYNEIEVVELYLYTINNGDIYRRYTTKFIKTLARRIKKGDYSKEKALILYKRLADIGAKQYAKDFCTNINEWNKVFSVADRKEVANRMEEYYRFSVIECSQQ